MTVSPRAPSRLGHAALTRFRGLGLADDHALAALRQVIDGGQPRLIRRELQREGQPIDQARFIVDGWAARVRIMPDGRRQVISVLLPGELYGHCAHHAPLAVSTIVALTDVTIASAPDADRLPALRQIYALSGAIEEANLLAQIVRLGRLAAQERIADFLLELHERLMLIGLAVDGAFFVPLTQETLADMLGLTAVHVNRSLQALRRTGMVEWRGQQVTLTDPAALARQVGRTPTRVSAAHPPVASRATFG